MGFKKSSFNNAAARRDDFSGQRNRRRSHDGGGHFGDQARSFKSVKQAPNEHSTNFYQPRFPSHQDRPFERDNRPGSRFQARSFKPTNPNRHLDQGSRPWHDQGQRHHHPATNVSDGTPRKFSSIHIEADLQKEVEKLIIEAVENDNRPMPVGILMGKLEGRLQIENFRKVILQTMDELIARKVLKTLPSGKIVIDYIDAPVDLKNTKEGTIFINHKGAGFIKLLNQEVSSYYVHSMNLNDALNGDVVKFAPLIRKSRNELKDAKVLEVLKRNKQEFVGLVFKTHEQDQIKFYLKPDDEKVSRQFLIVNPKGLVAGHKVLTRILNFGADEAQCEVLQVLGHENDVGVDISSIVYDHGIKPEFEPPVLAQVSQLNLDLERAQQQKMRVDLRNLNFITIDPATSKDLDDAVYVEQLAEHYHLKVAIADVAHYVTYNSLLDEAAIERGTSIYLLNQVIPMLPHLLSNDLCSLNPHEPRLSVVCDFNVSLTGVIDFASTKVYPAIITNQRRFSYDEVNAFFETQTPLADVNQALVTMLQSMRQLHEQMRQVKLRAGYIDFGIKEAKVVLNDQGDPIDVVLYEQKTAQLMIEDFMVAANEAVTWFAQSRKLPFIYRVHEKPELKSLENFALEAKKLHFKLTNNLHDLQPNTVSQWLQNNRDNQHLDIIRFLLLRSMEKAHYSANNKGHFGLASPHYTHFTSPIRRYPDLLVHRLLWMFVFDQEHFSDLQRQTLTQKLETLAQKASFLEVRAVEVERHVQNYKLAQYMEKFVGTEYEAIVISVGKFGMFVQLPNTVEGIVKMNNMSSDYFEYNPATNQLTGANSGQKLGLGTKVKVRLLEVNRALCKIDFNLVSII